MTVDKSARKSVKGRPFTSGDPRSGHGPAKGAPNAGRPPDVFRELCKEIASRGAMALLARKVMQNPKHPAFQSALRWATEHGYGKPTEKHELTGKDGTPLPPAHVTVTLVRPVAGDG